MKRFIQTTWWLAAVLTFTLSAPSLHAQDPSRTMLERAAPAAVRIRAVRGVPAPATGIVIDRRGYVITNFHAVGYIDAAKGVPGTLFSASNRYELELPDPSSDEPSVWVARVVRGDIRADLALLRLMAPMGPEQNRDHFSSIALGSTQNVGRNSVLWALGYKGASSKPVLTHVTVRDIQRSQLSRLSWIFFKPGVDKEFTGGVLLDSMVNMVAIPTATLDTSKGSTIERARPVERISTDWLDALRRGHIHDTRIDGFKPLADGGELHDLAEGDSPSREQSHFFKAPNRRPVAVTVTPPLPLTLLGTDGKVLNKGSGTLTVRSQDPQLAVIEVDVSQSLKHALAYSVRTGSPGTIPSKDATKTTMVAAGKGIVSGRMVHAVTGEPLKDAVVSIGYPGTNMEKLIGRFLRGEVSRSELQTQLLGQARTDRNGRFQIRNLPHGKDLPIAGYKMTFRPVYLSAQISPTDLKLDLGNIKMTYWEPIAY